MVTPPHKLSTAWEPALAQAFEALMPQQQDFLLVYLKTGNDAEAYRRSYNPNAEPHLASVCGSQTLATTGILEALKRFESKKVELLWLISQTYREMILATKAH